MQNDPIIPFADPQGTGGGTKCLTVPLQSY